MNNGIIKQSKTYQSISDGRYEAQKGVKESLKYRKQIEKQGTFLPLITKSQSKQKQKIFWDVDDVVLDSSEAIVLLINEHILKPLGKQTKTVEDCTQWDYKTIWDGMDREKTEELFASDQFWNVVLMRRDFIEMVQSGFLTKNYDNIFITKGTERNLYKKREFLEEALGKYWEDFEYIALDMDQKKSSIDMTGGIQIDDLFVNLDHTNAHLKILVQNGIATPFNGGIYLDHTMPDSNLYKVDYLDQVKEILEFNLQHRL